MPNHFTNRLTITGTKEQIDAFEVAFIKPQPYETECIAFSFGKLIPMPPILRRVCEDGAARGGRRPNLFVTAEGSAGFAERAVPATDAEWAEITSTGHHGWYDWSIAKWGTKWDAYSVDYQRTGAESAELKFDTAWSEPEPVFLAMSKHPTIAPLKVSIVGFDEGGCGAYRATMTGGELSGGPIEVNDEVYEEVYGEPPEVTEDDE